MENQYLENKSSGSNLDLTKPTFNTMHRLEERNRIAREFITDYAGKHAFMDVGVGLIGLLPFAALPALATAIAAQSPFIYQPMARDLAKVYNADPEKLGGAKETIIKDLYIETVKRDIAADFGVEFMMQIAHELVLEAGIGVIGALCIPVIGGAVGAAFDYVIATQMTWRVGTSVSIYFQNGGNWVGDQQHTLELSKEMCGPLSVGVDELKEVGKEFLKSGNLDNSFKEHHTPRVDLNDIRGKVPEVRENLLANVRLIAKMMQSLNTNEQIRAMLKSQGIPIDLIEIVLSSLNKSERGQ